MLDWENEGLRLKGINTLIAATHQRKLPHTSWSALAIDAYALPVPVRRLLRDIHVPALSKTIVEGRSDCAPDTTTTAVIKSYNHSN